MAELNQPASGVEMLIEGFRIPDFKGDVRMPSLRHAIEARKAHIEMVQLIESMKDHSNIPVTFDGQMPAYAFNPNLQRIIIGQRYMVKDEDGVERPAEVTGATVVELERVAYCGVTFENGRHSICTMPLSEEELDAWWQHPDTFFGTVGQRNTRAETPVEMYDFLHEHFLRTSKEELLSAMKGAPDFEHLSKMDHAKLADIHAERMTNAAWASVTRTASEEGAPSATRHSELTPIGPKIGTSERLSLRPPACLEKWSRKA